jgi:hypothetical protein
VLAGKLQVTNIGNTYASLYGNVGLRSNTWETEMKILGIGI